MAKSKNKEDNTYSLQKEIINAQRHILSRKKCLPKNDEKNVSKEKDDLETVIKTTPKQQANPNSRMKLKRRFSCKLCDKRSYAESHSLKEHERNIHGAPGPGCYGPWPAPYYSTQQQQSPTQK